ncbi:hypothetical protein LCGC14_1894010, partial [marine sediment metagenome]
MLSRDDETRLQTLASRVLAGGSIAVLD